MVLHLTFKSIRAREIRIPVDKCMGRFCQKYYDFSIKPFKNLGKQRDSMLESFFPLREARRRDNFGRKRLLRARHLLCQHSVQKWTANIKMFCVARVKKRLVVLKSHNISNKNLHMHLSTGIQITLALMELKARCYTIYLCYQRAIKKVLFVQKYSCSMSSYWNFKLLILESKTIERNHSDF